MPYHTAFCCLIIFLAIPLTAAQKGASLDRQSFLTRATGYFQQQQDPDLKQLAETASQLQIFEALQRLTVLSKEKNISQSRRSKINNLIETYTNQRLDYFLESLNKLGGDNGGPGDIIASFLGLPWNTISLVNTFPTTKIQHYGHVAVSDEGVIYDDSDPFNRSALKLSNLQEISDYTSPPDVKQRADLYSQMQQGSSIAIMEHTTSRIVLTVPCELEKTRHRWFDNNRCANLFGIDQYTKTLICLYLPCTPIDFLTSMGHVCNAPVFIRTTDLYSRKTKPVRCLTRLLPPREDHSNPQSRIPAQSAHVCGKSIIKATLPTTPQSRLIIQEYAYYGTDCGHTMTFKNPQRLTCSDGSTLTTICTSPAGRYIISNLKDAQGNPVYLALRRHQASSPPRLTCKQAAFLCELQTAHAWAVENNKVVHLTPEQSKILASCATVFQRERSSKQWQLPRTMRTRLRRTPLLKK